MTDLEINELADRVTESFLWAKHVPRHGSLGEAIAAVAQARGQQLTPLEQDAVERRVLRRLQPLSP